MVKSYQTFTVTDGSTLQALGYINKLWQKLERYMPHDDDTLVGLPKPYVVPSLGSSLYPQQFNEQFYWDTYFINLGLLGTEHHQLAQDMIENLTSLIGRFGFIPNCSRFYAMSRSQPPFLTSMIFDLYALSHDKKWLAEQIFFAKEEYRKVWLHTKHPFWHQVFRGLSRYYDINAHNDLVECESGWDLTPRFGHHSLNYLPIDLNALLYKYETDFAHAAVIAGEQMEAREWLARAARRQATINELMWDSKAGFYFDYDYVNQKKSPIYSLAGFFPMWVGLVSDQRAHQMVNDLRRFEHLGGLAATEKADPDRTLPEQWSYPTGWAPLHYIVIEGLKRYGYKEEAKRIALKWLKTNLYQFQKNGVFYEKYNVVEPGKLATEGLYPLQIGFGWTNGVFHRLAHEYILEDQQVQTLHQPPIVKTMLFKEN